MISSTKGKFWVLAGRVFCYLMISPILIPISTSKNDPKSTQLGIEPYEGAHPDSSALEGAYSSFCGVYSSWGIIRPVPAHLTIVEWRLWIWKEMNVRVYGLVTLVRNMISYHVVCLVVSVH
jgi:hypothetical protein